MIGIRSIGSEYSGLDYIWRTRDREHGFSCVQNNFTQPGFQGINKLQLVQPVLPLYSIKMSQLDTNILSQQITRHRRDALKCSYWVNLNKPRCSHWHASHSCAYRKKFPFRVYRAAESTYPSFNKHPLHSHDTSFILQGCRVLELFVCSLRQAIASSNHQTLGVTAGRKVITVMFGSSHIFPETPGYVPCPGRRSHHTS